MRTAEVILWATARTTIEVAHLAFWVVTCRAFETPVEEEVVLYASLLVETIVSLPLFIPYTKTKMAHAMDKTLRALL